MSACVFHQHLYVNNEAVHLIVTQVHKWPTGESGFEMERPTTSLSDELEAVSPGSLAVSECSETTSESASPARDFTHPSLGFWSAPLASEGEKQPLGDPCVTPLAADSPACMFTENFDLPVVPGEMFTDNVSAEESRADVSPVGMWPYCTRSA